MRRISIIAVFLLAVNGIFSARPTDPWVIRGVMPDNKIRMIILNLDNDLTAAYDGVNCGLYMMMDQIMDDVNDTYRHGGGSIPCTWLDPSPNGQCHASHMPKGNQMYKKTDENVWSVRQGNTALNAKAEYQGYYLFDETVTLIYRIKLSETQTIEIKETPDVGIQNNSINRQFDITGIPAGYSVNLALGGTGSTSWNASGTGTIQGSGGNQALVQSANGVTTVTGSW